MNSKPQPDAVTLTFDNPTPLSFSLNQLPTSLNLSKFSAATLSFDPPAGSFSGDISVLQQLSAVPEPASVVLLGIGLAVLFGHRRYRRVQGR